MNESNCVLTKSCLCVFSVLQCKQKRQMAGEGEKRYLLLLVSKMENSKTFMFCLSSHRESLAELEVEAISPLSIFFHREADFSDNDTVLNTNFAIMQFLYVIPF